MCFAMNHVDILRQLYDCATDAELAEQRGYSRPTLSRWRKLGIPPAKREEIAEALRGAGRAVPEGLLRPQLVNVQTGRAA